MNEPVYRCSACNASVSIVGSTLVVRSCSCGDVPVVAEMAAVAKGAGGLRAG